MKSMQFAFFVILFINISSSCYCSLYWAESQGRDSAEVSDCAKCGTQVENCEGSGSTCMLSNNQCVPDPKSFNKRAHTLPSEKRPVSSRFDSLIADSEKNEGDTNGDDKKSSRRVLSGPSSGIFKGHLASTAEIIGSCEGEDDVWGEYICSGRDNYIKWNLDLHEDDFIISSDFKADSVDATALTFVLWSGSTMYHIGLDGASKKLFYEGGNWGSPSATKLGATPLVASQFQTILLKRTGNFLVVSFAGEEWEPLSLDVPINAVGWGPSRNRIHVKNIYKH